MQQTQVNSPFQFTDVEKIWPRVLERLQNSMAEEQFETWVQGAYPISYDRDVCVIAVRNAYVQSWLTSRMTTSFGDFISLELNESTSRLEDFKPVKVTVKFQPDTQNQTIESGHQESPVEQLWNKTLNELQMRTPRASFDTWIRDTRAISIREGVLKIGARNSFTCDWLETRMQVQITELAKGFDTSINAVKFVVVEDDSDYTPEEENESADETSAAVESTETNSTNNFTAEVVDATQYENEVHPDRIVVLDGYALRLMEHGDLTPKDLSLWVGFRQAVYLHMKKNKGTVKNIPYWDVIQFAMMSRATYFRETSNKQDGFVGGLVEEVGVDVSEHTNDRRIDNARRFRVHMAPRLTRRDCATIERLIEQEVCLATTFDEAREFALNALRHLAEETPGRFLNVPSTKTNSPGTHCPRSVVEIVCRVLDLRGDMPQNLYDAAEKLQNRILFGFGKIYITHHFLRVVTRGLGLTHPQAWAIIALRAKRWYDKDVETYLDWSILPGGLDDLGKLVGVDRKTVKRWMSHAGFRLFVTPETPAPHELPEGWDARTTLFHIRTEEPVQAEIAAAMGSPEKTLATADEADKMSNAPDKMSNGRGQNEQRSRTNWDSVADKVSNGPGQNEQRLNKILLNPTNSYQLLGSPPVGEPPGKGSLPGKAGALPRAGVGSVSGFWDFDALMRNNSVLNPGALLAANKKFGRDLKTLCRGFVSLLLYAHSEFGGKLRVDPTALAVSSLRKNLHAGAGGDYDLLAGIPPRNLQAFFENDLGGIPCGDDADDAEHMYRLHYGNLPRADKEYLYRRLYGVRAGE